MTTLLMGGRNCFCRRISGPKQSQSRLLGSSGEKVMSIPVSFSKIATTPMPSISLPFGRVVRSADSQSRCLPLGSVYVVLHELDLRSPQHHSNGGLQHEFRPLAWLSLGGSLACASSGSVEGGAGHSYQRLTRDDFCILS
jgi:hypothetical protein